MEGGVDLSIMSHLAYSYFFFRFPCLSDLPSSFASFNFHKLAHACVKITLHFPISSPKRTQFYLLMFILDRISSRRSSCEMTTPRGESKSIPFPPRGFFLFSEHC